MHEISRNAHSHGIFMHLDNKKALFCVNRILIYVFHTHFVRGAKVRLFCSPQRWWYPDDVSVEITNRDNHDDAAVQRIRQYLERQLKSTLLNGLSVVKVFNRRAMDDEGEEEDDTPTRARSNAHRLPDVNVWVSAGVCVYSYSKILLFKYIDLLSRPTMWFTSRRTASTFPHAVWRHFSTTCSIAKASLASLSHSATSWEISRSSVSVGSSYWLGKKFYYYQTVEGKEVPQKTIAEDGTSIQLVDRSLYEHVYARAATKKLRDFAPTT